MAAATLSRCAVRRSIHAVEEAAGFERCTAQRSVPFSSWEWQLELNFLISFSFSSSFIYSTYTILWTTQYEKFIHIQNHINDHQVWVGRHQLECITSQSRAAGGVRTTFHIWCLVRRDRGGWIAFSVRGLAGMDWIIFHPHSSYGDAWSQLSED